MRIKCVRNGKGMGITEMCTGFLAKESDGKMSLRETRCRWENKNRVALKVIEFDGVHCVHVTELRHSWWAVYNMVVIVRIA
jgi:hypothetical protein